MSSTFTVPIGSSIPLYSPNPAAPMYPAHRRRRIHPRITQQVPENLPCRPRLSPTAESPAQTPESAPQNSRTRRSSPPTNTVGNDNRRPLIHPRRAASPAASTVCNARQNLRRSSPLGSVIGSADSTAPAILPLARQLRQRTRIPAKMRDHLLRPLPVRTLLRLDRERHRARLRILEHLVLTIHMHIGFSTSHACGSIDRINFICR